MPFLTDYNILNQILNIHPLIAFAAVLIAIIAYRFIPDDKTVELRVPFSATIKATKAKELRVNLRMSMMIIVSIAVLTSALYTILIGEYDDGTQKWAFASVGSIVTFWLK